MLSCVLYTNEFGNLSNPRQEALRNHKVGNHHALRSAL